MEKKLRYTLGKNERLKSRKQIEQLFKAGKSFSSFPLRVIYLLLDKTAATEPVIQAGFSVSSRNFKKAVDRNRIKRLMREAYRLQKNEFELMPQSTPKRWVVFFIYTGNEVPDYELVFVKMTKALKQLQKISNESVASDM